MGLKIVLDTKEASRNADEFAKSIGRIAQATGLAGKSADELMRMTASMSRRFGRISGSAEKAAASVSRMGVGMDKASKGADKFSQSASRASGTSGKLAQQVKRLAGAFLGFRAVSASVSTLAKLEQGIVTLGTVTGKTGKELENLQETAVRVAQATKFTPAETTQALLELSRAGQSAALAAESLIDVSNLAAAGVLGLGQAAGLVAATMAQFRDDTLSAEDVASTFVAVADRTKSTVTTLGSAMSQAGQAAASFGVSLEQTVVAVGTLQTAGIQASRTGRALKTILSSLATADKTSRGQSALERLGLDAEDVTAKGGDLIGMLKRIGGALDGITSDRERVGILTTLVGKDFFSILQAMTDGVDDMDDLMDQLGNKQSELSEKAERQNDTLQGSILNVTSAFQEMVLVSGDAGATGTLKGFFNTVAGGIRLLGGVKGAFKDATTSMVVMSAAVKGIGIAVAMKLAVAAVTSLGASLVVMKNGLLGVASANKAVSASSPWGLAALAIGGVITAIDLLSLKERKRDEANQERKRRDAATANADSGDIAGIYDTRTTRNKSKSPSRLLADAQLAQSGLSSVLNSALSQIDEFEDAQRGRPLGERAKGTVPLSALSSTRFSLRGDRQSEVQEAFRLQKLQDELDSTTIAYNKLSDARQNIGGEFTPGASEEELALGKRLSALKEAIGGRSQTQIGKKQLNEFIDAAGEDVKAKIKEIQAVIDKGKPDVVEKEVLSEAAKSLQTSINDIDISRLKDKIKEAITNEVATGIDFVGDSALEEEIVNLRLRNIEINNGKDLEEKDRDIILERLKIEQDYASEKLKASALKKKAAQDSIDERKAEREKLALSEKVTKEMKEQAKLRKKLNDFRTGELVDRAVSSLSEKLQDQVNAARAKFAEAREAGETLEGSLAAGARAASGVAAQQQAETESEQRKKDFQVATEEFKTQKQALESVGATFGNSLGQALLSIADGANTAKEAFSGMAKSIISQLIQMQLTKGFSALFGLGAGPEPQEESSGGIGSFLSNLVRSLGSAAAKPEQMGGVIPAQMGRVISSPTTVTRGGRNYSISEGGGSTPEAVFPLTKNSRGQLSLMGTGGGSTTLNMSFPGIKNSNDAKAAKRTIGQAVSALMTATESKRNRSGMRPKR